MEYWKEIGEILKVYTKGLNVKKLLPLAAEHVANIHQGNAAIKPGCGIVTVYNRELEVQKTIRYPDDIVCRLIELYRFIDNLALDDRAKHILFWWYSAYVWHGASPMSVAGWDEIPHHTVLDVIDTLAAFSLARKDEESEDEEGLSLLLFSFSPVQPFIEGAKKLKDLWGGSYLLSLFTLSAIKRVFERYTPYSIILPSIRHNHMVYMWLKHRYGDAMRCIEGSGIVMETPLFMPEYPDKYLPVAGLPNRILMLVPTDMVEVLVGEMEDAIRKTWHWAIEKTICQLKKVDCWGKYQNWQRLVEEEAKTFPQTYHAAIELTSNFEDIRRFFEDADAIARQWEYVENWFRRVTESNTHPDPATYILWHTDAVAAKHGGVKAFTPYYPYGVYVGNPPLYMDDLSARVPAIFERRDENGRVDRFGVASLVKRYMEKMALAIIEDKDEAEPLPPQRYMDFDTGATFPSVSWVAAYKWLKYAGEQGYSAEKVREMVGNEGLWSAERISDSGSVDGDRDNGDEPPNPSGYYSVLMLDGDRMGAWFSATHEVISKHTKESDFEWMSEKFRDLLLDLDPEQRRSIYRGVVLGPAYLRNLSSAVGTFAYLVPAIVMKHHGFMVYVGGDDVLAVLPPETVFDAIHDIKMLFAGGGPEGMTVGDYTVKKGILYWRCKPVAMLTGTAHTMSGGVAIYWLKDPLILAVRDAREGEGKAKAGGRNAVWFVMRERGGRPVEGLLKWDDDMRLWGVGSLAELNDLLRRVFSRDGGGGEKLSKSFLYEMYASRVELEAMGERREWDLMRSYFAYFLRRHGLANSGEIRNRLARCMAHRWWRDALAYMKVWLRIEGRGR